MKQLQISDFRFQIEFQINLQSEICNLQFQDL